MKHLNKIILINSANIPYQEIKLNGNVHFIGTQGTGKSTVQRAVLYFYTASSRRENLGLKPSQKGFADFYFPHENSYLIYEVSSEPNPFFILLYKRQNGIRFLFVDAPYDRDVFINGNEAKLLRDVFHTLHERGYRQTNKIEKSSEYRDVIYGKNRKYEYFALMKSTTYENIPRTIRNVFLNSKLESSFIKNTIIESISEHFGQIDLDAHKKQLRDFNHSYEQLEIYHNHKPVATKMLKQYESILQKRQQLQQMAGRIGEAVKSTRMALEEKQEEMLKLKSQSESKSHELENTQAQYQQKIDQLKNELSILQDKIRTTEKKILHYERQNIQALLEEFHKEDQYKNERKDLFNQKELLTANIKDVEQKYAAREESLSHKLEKSILKLEQRFQQEKDQNFQQKEEIRQRHAQRLEEIQQERTAEIQQKQATLKAMEQQLNEVEKELFRLEYQQPFAQEINKFQQELQRIERETQNCQREIEKHQQQLEQIEQNAKLLDKQEETELTAQQQQYHPKIEKLKNRLQEIQDKLRNQEGSLFDFLKQNVENWEDSYGKILHEQLMFAKGLSPALTHAQAQNILGLELDLSALPVIPEYTQSFEKQQENLERNLREVQEELQQALQQVQENFAQKRKYQQDKSRKSRKEMESRQYVLDKLERAQKEAAFQLEHWQQESEREKNKRSEEANTRLNVLSEQKEKAETEVKALEEKLQQETAQLRQEHKQLIAQAEQALNEILQKLGEEKQQLEADFNKEAEALKQEKYQELQGHNTDTEKLRKIEEALSQVEAKLQAIEDKRVTVIQYRSDLEEYIHPLEERRMSLKRLEKLLIETEAEKRQESQAIRQIISKLNEQIGELKESVQIWRGQLSDYEKSFKALKCYDKYREYIEQAKGRSDERKLTTLWNELNREDQQLNESEHQLYNQLSGYTGKFPENNLFGFPVRFADPFAKEAFLQQLKDFVREERIKSVEEEAHKKFSMMIESLSGEYEQLLKSRREIEQVISKINREFKQSNFVGAIRQIELRTSESTHKVIQELKRIKEHAETHRFELGEVNLFSQASNSQANKQAIDLLKKFYDIATASRHEHITVQDTFELQFRVQENDNDTGWVDQLSNVGSNGTDVLVKAMVYIMLLHVFKEKAKSSRQKTPFALHCIIDEVGVLHDSNIRGLAGFANEKQIWLINGSPNANDADSYRHIYEFRKNKHTNQTKITKLLTVRQEEEML
jgi:chromosome segregation ATPase